MGFEENVISPFVQEKHNINRYSFKTISQEDLPEGTKHIVGDGQPEGEPLQPLNTVSDKADNGDEVPTENKQGQNNAGIPPPPPQQHASQPVHSAFDKKIIDDLFAKVDMLNSSLQTMQQQFVKQQQDFEKRIAEESAKATETGYQKGLNDAKAAMEKEVEDLKGNYITSIDELQKTSAEFKASMGNVEKELASVAVDIAKEVIESDVSKTSAAIATNLAKALIDNLKDATKIILKLNPNDFKSVNEALKEDERVTFKADKAITKGGVVIVSDSGNIDGTINSRFDNIKKNILKNRDA